MREAALARLGDVRATEVDAGEWQGGELQDLATPSLFGEARALLVTDAGRSPKDALGELGRYLAAPDPDATLVICCQVAERGKVAGGPPEAGEAGRHDHARSRSRARSSSPGSPVGRRRLGVDMRPAGARALVETLGRSRPARRGPPAAGVARSQARRSRPQIVAQQFRGLGEQKAWDLCDRAFAKDLPGAIRSLTSIEAGRRRRAEDAGRHRQPAPRSDQGSRAARPHAAGAGREGRPGSGSSGRPRRYQQQARNFSMAQLLGPARAHHRRRSRAEVGRDRRRGMPVLIAAIAA